MKFENFVIVIYVIVSIELHKIIIKNRIDWDYSICM